MRYILILLLFFTFNKLISQETIDMKEVYMDNNLVYKTSDDKLLTGVALLKRKKGHLIYEEEYENGIILSQAKYFNFKKKELFEKTIYYKEKPFVPRKKTQYHSNKKGTFNEIFYYDINGKKILEERMEDDILTYKCEYSNGKKVGMELCHFKNGEVQYSCNYINGKKDGQEYCVNKKGKVFIKNYSMGKKIK